METVLWVFDILILNEDGSLFSRGSASGYGRDENQAKNAIKYDILTRHPNKEVYFKK